LPPAPVAPDLVPDPAPAPRPPQDAIRLAQPAPLPATPRNERPKVERSVVKVFRGPPNPGVRQTLSTEEIRRRILDGARLGAVDTLPPSELERNYLQIRRVLYEAWMQPSAGEAGSQPAEMEIRLDASGNVVGSRLIATSGSAVFDQTVQSAVQSVRRIQGLSASFARQNPRVTVEFRLEP
jgi:outer membrane biosynthesis protein TonB